MNKNLFLTVMAAALVTIALHFILPAKTAISPALQAKAAETALERVKRTGVLRCGYSPWPPYYELDANTKQLSGFFKEIAETVISLTGWKIAYVQVVPGNDVLDLQSGKIDAMCGTGPWYLNAIKEIDFTMPLGYAAAYVFGRADEGRFATPDDVNENGVGIVGVEGDVSVDLAQRFYPLAKIATLPATADPAQMLLNVTTRKADVTITDPVTVMMFNKNNADKLKSLFPDHPVAVYGMEFSVKKGEFDLWQALNTYSEMALNMNMIDPILKKYDATGEMFLPVAKPYQAQSR